ncbi:MAG: class I SAM-dependent methyltransferase, partial [Burkholderiaceae bacterium]
MISTISPQAQYRERLLSEVISFRPQSILEVGCGSGAFLRSAATLGVSLQGLDPDAALVRKIQSEGFTAQVGVAEDLPFKEASVDVVVFSYTAHHIYDWPKALAEALRVCRLGVVVLDPWYDDKFSSQLNTRAFDEWSKSIDRANGMVHNDCLDAQALLSTEVLARADLFIK